MGINDSIEGKLQDEMIEKERRSLRQDGVQLWIGNSGKKKGMESEVDISFARVCPIAPMVVYKKTEAGLHSKEPRKLQLSYVMLPQPKSIAALRRQELRSKERS